MLHGKSGKDQTACSHWNIQFKKFDDIMMCSEFDDMFRCLHYNTV